MAGRADIIAGRAWVELRVNNSAFYRGLADARNRLREFGSDMQSIGRQLLVISAAMIVPLAMSAKTFASFDDEMRKVGARARGTAEELAGLREQAKELGATTSFTAIQVAALQAKVAQKGFDRSGVQAMTDDILNLARAAGQGGESSDGDVVTAADLVSGNLRAFKLEASEATYLSDLFSAAVNNSNFNLEGLVNAMSEAAPIANRYGISVKDTVNVLAQMTNVNIDAASAGTAFRNMLIRLSDETGRNKFNDTIKEMTGNTIEFVDGAGNLKPLPQLLFEVGDSIKGLGTAAQGQILSDLFGLRALIGGGQLTESRNGFQELNEILSDVEGTAKRTSDAMDAGMGGMFRILISAVEGVKLAIGEALNDSMISVGKTATDLLTIFRKLIDNNRDAVLTFAKWALIIGAVGAALMTVGLMASFASVSIGGLMAITRLAALSFSFLLLPVSAARLALSLVVGAVGLARAAFMSLVGVTAAVRTATIALAGLFSLTRIRIIAVAVAGAVYRTAVSVAAIATAIWRVVVTSAAVAMSALRLVIVAGVAAQLLWNATTLSSVAVVQAFYGITRLMTAGLVVLRSSILAASAVTGLLSAGYAAITSSATLATIASSAFAAIGSLIAALTSPIALTAAAIAGLGFVAFRAAGGFEGMATIARNVMGSVSRATGLMTERAGVLFNQMKQTAIDTFGGIRDAISAGDLALAGQIAITGLRIAFLQGMSAISSMIGGVWGDTVAQFATQIAGGDFAGAWNTIVLSMDAVWTNFTAGLFKSFLSAAREVLKVWRATVDGIANYFISQAAQGGIIGAALELASGVNVKEEVAKGKELEENRLKVKVQFEADKADIEKQLSAAIAAGDVESIELLNRQLAATMKNLEGIGETPLPDIFSQIQGSGAQGGTDWLDVAAQKVRDTVTAMGEQLGKTPEEIEQQIAGALDALESGQLPKFEEAAAEAGAALADSVTGGADAASAEIQRLQNELAALRDQAKEKIANANEIPVDKELNDQLQNDILAARAKKNGISIDDQRLRDQLEQKVAAAREAKGEAVAGGADEAEGIAPAEIAKAAAPQSVASSAAELIAIGGSGGDAGIQGQTLAEIKEAKRAAYEGNKILAQMLQANIRIQYELKQLGLGTT